MHLNKIKNINISYFELTNYNDLKILFNLNIDVKELFNNSIQALLYDSEYKQIIMTFKNIDNIQLNLFKNENNIWANMT